MELIDRYAYAVSRRLPESQRTEITDELRGTIEEMAVARAKGGEPTTADVKAVLLELGDPVTWANNYASPGYLIGPKWYDTYVKTLKQRLFIVPAVLAALSLVAGLTSHNHQAVTSVIFHALGTALSTALKIVAGVTLLFVIIEQWTKRKAPTMDPSKKMRAWTTELLPSLPKKTDIPAGDIVQNIVSIIVIAGALLLCLKFARITHNGQVVPLLNTHLWHVWMPALIVLCVAAIAHEFVKLKVGRWTKTLAVTSTLMGLAFVVFTLSLVATQSLVNPILLNATVRHTVMVWTTAILAVSSLPVWGGQVVQLVSVMRKAKK